VEETELQILQKIEGIILFDKA